MSSRFFSKVKDVGRNISKLNTLDLSLVAKIIVFTDMIVFLIQYWGCARHYCTDIVIQLSHVFSIRFGFTNTNTTSTITNYISFYHQHNTIVKPQTEVGEIHHTYNNMPKNPRYWRPSIFCDIYRAPLVCSQFFI